MKCCTLPGGEGKGGGKHHKGKVKHCSKKQWQKMPQICAGKPPRRIKRK